MVRSPKQWWRESSRESPKQWFRRIFWENPDSHAKSGRYAPLLPKFLPTLILFLMTALFGGWAMFVGFARLAGATIDLFRPTVGQARGVDLSIVARTTVTAAGLFAGIFAITYSYRKQRLDEAASHRADAESFSKRYQDAAAQLGHESVAVRLAGAYAMYHLAHDWKENRQSCVSVLCAYLRTSLDRTNVGDVQVRSTIQRILTGFMSETVQKKFPEDVIHFDLAGAHLHNFELHYARTLGLIDLRGAKLTGFLDVMGCQFEEGLIMQDSVLDNCHFSVTKSTFGLINLTGATFQSHSKLNIRESEFNLVILDDSQFVSSEVHVAVGPYSHRGIRNEIWMRGFTLSETDASFSSFGESANGKNRLTIHDGLLENSQLHIARDLVPDDVLDTHNIDCGGGSSFELLA